MSVRFFSGIVYGSGAVMGFLVGRPVNLIRTLRVHRKWPRPAERRAALVEASATQVCLGKPDQGKRLRCPSLGIGVELLIEVAHAEEQKHVGMALLRVPVLIHHGADNRWLLAHCASS